jgi:hypothetical protein
MPALHTPSKAGLLLLSPQAEIQTKQHGRSETVDGMDTTAHGDDGSNEDGLGGGAPGQTQAYDGRHDDRCSAGQAVAVGRQAKV